MKLLMLRLTAVVLLACGLTGCPETTVGDDFGLKPAVLKAADWNGDWTPVDDDEAVRFVVKDAAQGLLVMTEPGKKDDRPVEFKIRRASGDAKVKVVFAVARSGDGKKSGGQTFLLMREVENGVLYSWHLNHEAVAKAIQAGELKGTVTPDKDGAHSHLESTAGNYAKLLEPRFWNWSEPSCLKRGKK